MLAEDEVKRMILERIAPLLESLGRCEQAISTCNDVLAAARMTRFVDHLRKEAIGFCVRTECSGPFADGDQIRAVMNREIAPLLAQLCTVQADLGWRGVRLH
jgi:hypothetical protein